VIWALFRGANVPNPPAWLTKVSLLIEVLHCTEKQLYEEYSAETITECLTYVDLKNKAEELKEKELEAKMKAKTPTPHRSYH